MLRPVLVQRYTNRNSLQYNFISVVCVTHTFHHLHIISCWSNFSLDHPRVLPVGEQVPPWFINVYCPTDSNYPFLISINDGAALRNAVNYVYMSRLLARFLRWIYGQAYSLRSSCERNLFLYSFILILWALGIAFLRLGASDSSRRVTARHGAAGAPRCATWYMVRAGQRAVHVASLIGAFMGHLIRAISLWCPLLVLSSHRARQLFLHSLRERYDGIIYIAVISAHLDWPLDSGVDPRSICFALK